MFPRAFVMMQIPVHTLREILEVGWGLPDFCVILIILKTRSYLLCLSIMGKYFLCLCCHGRSRMPGPIISQPMDLLPWRANGTRWPSHDSFSTLFDPPRLRPPLFRQKSSLHLVSVQRNSFYSSRAVASLDGVANFSPNILNWTLWLSVSRLFLPVCAKHLGNVIMRGPICCANR